MDYEDYGDDAFADTIIYRQPESVPQYEEGSDALNIDSTENLVVSTSGESDSDGRVLDTAEPLNRQKPADMEESDESGKKDTDASDEKTSDEEPSGSETGSGSFDANVGDEENKSSENHTEASQTSVDDSNPETTDPAEEKSPEEENIVCPFCGRKLIHTTLMDTPWLVHEHASTIECKHIFADITQVKEASKLLAKMNDAQKDIDNIQKSNTDKYESDMKKQEALEKTQQDQNQPSPAAVPQMLTLSPELLASFKDDKGVSSVLLLMLSENMKTINAQISKINEDILFLKKESLANPEVLKSTIQNYLKEDMTLDSIKKASDDTSSMLKESNESIKHNIEALSKTADTIMKQYSIAAMVYEQYIHSVRVIDKSRIRYATLLPDVKDYLKIVDARYQSMLKDYDKEVKAVGENFTKQINQFMQDAKKKNLLSPSGKNSSPDVMSYIIPTIIAFVLMFIISFVSR